MTREEIDLKIYEWCEFKLTPMEPGLAECSSIPCFRCRLCVRRSALWYSIMAGCNIIAPVPVLIRRVIKEYENKTGRVIFVEKP